MEQTSQQEGPYDDGLAPPPNLPSPAAPQSGTVEQAEAMQQQNNVPEKFRGPWYHETYDNIGALDNQHDEWTWFTRSPSGETIWGETVLIAYVVAVPENSKVHATSNKGDKVGHEGERGKAGQVRYWRYGQAEQSPDLAISDRTCPASSLSRFEPNTRDVPLSAKWTEG